MVTWPIFLDIGPGYQASERGVATSYPGFYFRDLDPVAATRPWSGMVMCLAPIFWEVFEQR